ncbi:MAG: carbamoyl phosphate synthase small subunit [Oscillospiraceae bacterium]|nr:carbamoyl phosphate synthase small subunit [Oscillospiraceae bacterium]
MKKAYLVLENGEVFEGLAIGAEREQIGELVFTTGMTGYLETLTDPSYAGQIILQTFPLIGNYGVIPEDFEGDCLARGYVVRELCDLPSNFRSEGTLDSFLKEKSVPGLCGVDTRAIAKRLREQGTMNAAICTEIPASPEAIRKYRITGAVEAAGGKKLTRYPASGESRNDSGNCARHVVLVDYGAKRNILRCLLERGCEVTVVPHDTTAEEILALNPDGIMLSNGPGDPEENVSEIAQIQKLIGRVPIFGICLGHQLTALAMGGRTVKLKYGHHGANQPVTDGTHTWITSQNHNYAVLAESLSDTAEMSFWNANDGSCEGLNYRGRNAFTVQFHPEACGGPHDTEYLFDRFMGMMEEKHAER